MKRDGLFTGLLLLGIGVLFLLDNFHLINFHWSNIFSLWPLFLIIPGINLIFKKDHSSTANIIKISVVIIVFALVLFRGTRPANSFLDSNHFGYSIFDDDNKSGDNDDDSSDVKINKIASTDSYNEPYNAAVTNATLNIRGGGVSYTLADTTSSLFSAVTQVHNQRFLFSTTASDSGKVINFITKNGHNMNWGDDDNGNQATIKLNPNPVWALDIAAGASTVKFDLSKYKVKTIHLKGGAASVDLKLGQPAGNMMVDVATGVSEVNISVPNGVACQILSKTGLSSKTYNGFDDKGNSRFETPNFASSPNKIYLNLKGGVSDFNVSRY